MGEWKHETSFMTKDGADSYARYIEKKYKAKRHTRVVRRTYKNKSDEYEILVYKDL